MQEKSPQLAVNNKDNSAVEIGQWLQYRSSMSERNAFVITDWCSSAR